MKQFRISFDNVSKYRTELYGISILWIMLFHFEGTYPVWAKSFLKYGNMGCELFIFASGVSLYFAMQKKPSLSRYFRRRLLRVLLPVILICSFEWIPLFLNGNGPSQFFKLLTRYSCINFWITGEQQTWFLSFIILAYLLYPYIYSFLFESRNNIWLHSGILIAVWLAVTFSIYYLAPKYFALTEIALTRGPVFLIGCACGRIVYEKKSISRHAVIYISGMILIIILSFVAINYKMVNGVARRYFYLMPGISLTILIPQIFDITSKFIRHHILRYLGNTSIELYLLHIMMGYHLLPKTGFYDRKNMLHYYVMLCVCIILSFPCSTLIHFLAGKINTLMDG